jgi:hypothetical protein
MTVPNVMNSAYPNTDDSAYKAALSSLESGNPAAALSILTRVLAKAPENPMVLYYTGLCFQLLGRLEEAVGHYQAAIDILPGFVQALLNLGKTLQRLERYEKAIQCFKHIISIDPENGLAAFNLGNSFLDVNQPDQAIHWLEIASTLISGNAPVYNNLGKAYMLKEDGAQAEQLFKKAIEIDPGLSEAWFNRAEIHSKNGRWHQAVDFYQQAIRLNPRMSAALNNCGNILRKLKRHEEALEAFQKVIELEPDLAEAYYNLGSTYRDIERFEDAVNWLSRAIQLKPDYAEAWNNLALTCKNCGDFQRALTYFNRALNINPDLAVAHWNRGFVHLLLGDWIDGWKDFEWRFKIPEHHNLYPHKINGRLWDGRPIPDKTLLVHDEQGLGDTFQFVRFLPWVRRRCGRLILETRKELVELFRDQACLDEMIIRSPDRPPDVSFDRYIPLMSLAGVMGTTAESRTFDAPYVVAPMEKTTCWKERLPKDTVNVGLVWAGRPEHANDQNRSCPLTALTPLFELGHIRFFGLQKGPAGDNPALSGIAPNFINLGMELRSFADTAGLLNSLDVLITVDTSVAHLAGAMGRPVWLMVPYIPDWRWGLNDSTTPWYPTMTLFRQSRPKDWATVIDSIRRRLLERTGNQK